MFGVALTDRDVSAGDARGQDESAGFNAIRHHLVDYSFQAIFAFDNYGFCPAPATQPPCG